MLDWSSCPAVERDPDRVSGAWVFRGTRVPVKALFENLESGARIDDFVSWFPGVSREMAEAVLEHAQRSLQTIGHGVYHRGFFERFFVKKIRQRISPAVNLPARIGGTAEPRRYLPLPISKMVVVLLISCETTTSGFPLGLSSPLMKRIPSGETSIGLVFA
jgi:uncharacterized protein (DUF433 family)